MEDDTILELLDIYMEMVEKQDEIIYRLGKIVNRQAEDIALLQNDRKYSCDGMAEEKGIANEVIGQYEEIKKKLDDYQP